MQESQYLAVCGEGTAVENPVKSLALTPISFRGVILFLENETATPQPRHLHAWHHEHVNHVQYKWCKICKVYSSFMTTYVRARRVVVGR